MTAAPGPLLARGRSADVFDVGGGRVLRRRRAADEDVASLWLLATVAEVDDVPRPTRPIVGSISRRTVDVVLTVAGRPSPETVDRVCERRLADPNPRAAELARIPVFRARYGRGGTGDASPYTRLPMSKKTKKRKARLRRSKANHGKRPNMGRG